MLTHVHLVQPCRQLCRLVAVAVLLPWRMVSANQVPITAGVGIGIQVGIQSPSIIKGRWMVKSPSLLSSLQSVP